MSDEIKASFFMLSDISTVLHDHQSWPCNVSTTWNHRLSSAVIPFIMLSRGDVIRAYFRTFSEKCIFLLLIEDSGSKLHRNPLRNESKFRCYRRLLTSLTRNSRNFLPPFYKRPSEVGHIFPFYIRKRLAISSPL